MKTAVLLCLLALGCSLYIEVAKGDSECVTRYYKKGQNMRGTYFISGEDEENQRVEISDEKKRIMWNSPNTSSSSFSITNYEGQNYSLCLINQSKGKQMFSFEFEDPNAEKHLVMGP